VQKTFRKALADLPPGPVLEESELEELLPLREETPEDERLLAVELLAPDDGQPPAAELQQIVERAAKQFNVPASFISIIQKDHQWLRASTGVKGGRLLEHNGVKRGDAFCTHVVQGQAPLLVPDAAVHPYFSQNPLVKEGLLRSYAGAPLVTPEGAVLGSLCIIDHKPMAISADQVDELVLLARRVAGELELSKARRLKAAGKKAPLTTARGEKDEGALGTWFDAVLDNIAEGVLLFDEQRLVILASRGLARMLLVPVADLLGKHRDTVLQELSGRFVNPEAFLRELRVPDDGPYALRCEFSTRTTGRRLRWVAKPVLLERGTGHLCVLTDVTLEAAQRAAAPVQAQTRGQQVERGAFKG
jgi:PAS domain-containing protein